jgi:hypothetical protein
MPTLFGVRGLRFPRFLFRLAMVTAPMRGLPILLLISHGYGESATAAGCQSLSDTMRT